MFYRKNVQIKLIIVIKNVFPLQLFGLALLITSSIYLKNLNKWEEHNSCKETIPEKDDKFSDILCSNYRAWRRAAIIGIIIVKTNEFISSSRSIFSFEIFFYNFSHRVSSMYFSYHFLYAVAVA